MELEGGYALSNLRILRVSVEPESCSEGGEMFTILENSQVMLSHLFESCNAEVALTAQVYRKILILLGNEHSVIVYYYYVALLFQLPDLGVLVGDNITVVATLSMYYATPGPLIEERKNYGLGEVRIVYNIHH